MADISYGDAASEIVARPIEPKGRKPAPSLTQEQRKKAAQERSDKQTAVEERIAGWMDRTDAEAEDMAAMFGKNKQYYLNLMFSGGPGLATGRKSNAYNAWLHHIAQNNHDGVDVVQLGKENIDDYKNLTKEEKEELLAALDEEKKSQSHGLRLTRKGRTKDVVATCKKVEDLFTGLQGRAGIEGFYMICRNTGDYSLKPRWWFSSKNLDEYLRLSIKKFEPEKIGVLSEAFAISGANYFAFLKTPKEKALHLKAEIRDYILEALRVITKSSHTSMSYVHFTRDIELVYRVTIVGWTADRFCNPSDLSNSVDELKKLRDALKEGTCKFVSLTDEQYQQIKQKYDEQVESGELPPRKKRKDAGTKRKKGGRERELEDGEGGEGEDDLTVSKRARLGDSGDGVGPSGTN